MKLKLMLLFLTIFVFATVAYANEAPVCSIPIDVMLVIDRSESMVSPNPLRLPNAKNAAITFVNSMNFSQDVAGLVTFSSSATLDQPLTSNKNNLINKINAISAIGATNIGEGFKAASDELFDYGRDNLYIVLLSDGASNVYPGGYCDVEPSAPNECSHYAFNQSEIAKDAGIEIFTIGVGINNFTEGRLKLYASSEDNYFFAPNSSALEAIYLQISEIICPCGDGDQDPGEECDDGNLINGDGCDNTCSLEYCGDFIINDGPPGGPGEECDDGPSGSNECTSTCELTFCGDFAIQNPNGFGQSEQCDDGPSGSSACTPQCTLTYCGDGTQQTPNGAGFSEECDDGNLVDGDGCDSTCILEYCGDSLINDGPPGGPGEECDDGPSGSPQCTTNCQLTYCGDNTLQSPNGDGIFEECDDGPSGSNACTPTCELTECGDTFVQSPNGDGVFEECDDGPSGSSACTPQCTLTYCGDNTIQDPNGAGFSEGCDDGPSGSSSCTPQCTLTYCGDFATQVPNGAGFSEECDDGSSGSSACTSTCTLTYCGDLTTQDPNGAGFSEECDDGPAGNPQCTTNCELTFCGDYITQNPNGEGLSEQCDQGLTGNDQCTSNCQYTVCGDSITQIPNGLGQSEECDDGQTGGNTDQCTDTCTLTYCGDSVKQTPNGNLEIEECDDGPAGSPQCTTNCKLTYCGDFAIQNPNGFGQSEECDHGPSGSSACTVDCTLTYCGDGTQQDPNGAGFSEECDDGPAGSPQCTPNCEFTICGDSITQIPNGLGQSEECDDGPSGSSACTVDCTLTYCGDSIQQDPNGAGFSEECDHGLSGSPQCTTSCEFTFCGDGIKQEPNGLGQYEECDGLDGVPESYVCTNLCILIKIPECDDIGYIDPYHNNGTTQWIDTLSKINITEDGEDVCGIPDDLPITYYIDNYLTGEFEFFCQNQELCSQWIGSSYTDQDWQLYLGAFPAGEESCHVIETYTELLGIKSEVAWDCVYVDKTAPDPVKEVGGPKAKWDGIDGELGNPFYPEAPDHCASHDCWRVTLMTPITMSCEDPEPHPSGEYMMCFWVDFDGLDITENECGEVSGNYNYTGDGSCCVFNEPVELYFDETTYHKLSFYCEDKVQKRSEPDVEYFKVEESKFEIELNHKWNLISIPFVLLDDSVSAVMEEVDSVLSVWGYDAVTDQWFVYTPDGDDGNDNLDNLEPGHGYWVLSNNSDMIVIGGSLFNPAATPVSIPIKGNAWNLIGYYGIDGQLGYYGPFGNGDQAGCHLASIDENVRGWSALMSYWEPLNPYQWHTHHQYPYPGKKGITEHDFLDPGAGYWVFAQDGDVVYAPSTICNEV